MATPFQCPCGRALIADDAHRGLEVRCPACGRRLLVPATPGAVAPEAAPAAQLTSPAPGGPCPHCGSPALPEAGKCPSCGAFVDAAIGTAPPPPTLRICPKCGAQIPVSATTCRSCGAFLDARASPRAGLPWEHRASLGWIDAGWQTLKLVVFQPWTAFRAMSLDDGLGNALTYYLIFYIGPSVLFLAVGGGLLLAFWGAISAFLVQQIPNFPATALTTGLLTACYLGALVLLPVLYTAMLFLFSGILHLMLMLVGGARRTFATTFSAVAYSYTSTSLAQLALCCFTLIPYLGGCISFILTLWAAAWVVIALIHAHETDTWRALLAVLVPVLVCGGLCLGFVVLGMLQQHATGIGLP